MTAMRRKASLFVALMLSVGGLAACTSLFGGEEVKVRPIENMTGLTSSPHDRLYESAASAINARDYGRALDYLQAARDRDPRNVKALNALGVVYDKLGRFDLSARYYAQARAIEPESRILAENIGYSRVLQNLLNPGRQVAVATIELPADLNNSSPEQPTMVVSAPAAAVAPSVSPPEKLITAALATHVGVMPAVLALEKPEPAVATPAIVSPAKVPAAASTVIAWVIPIEPAKALVRKQAIVTPVLHATAVPAQSRNVVPLLATNKKVFVIGQPVKILNASGSRDRFGVVSRRLAVLGWTVRPSDAPRVQPATTLFYPAKNAFAAKAMQRTLPFPVRLVQDAGSASAIQLVIGRDYLSWKPRNARLAALWQKGIIVASLQKPSIRGTRQ
jgi:hypothetical protein